MVAIIFEDENVNDSLCLDRLKSRASIIKWVMKDFSFVGIFFVAL
jgi:hypothetical protein